MHTSCVSKMLKPQNGRNQLLDGHEQAAPQTFWCLRIDHHQPVRDWRRADHKPWGGQFPRGMVYVRKMGFDTSLPVFLVFRVGSQAPTNTDQLHFWCRCCQNSASVQQRPIERGDRIWGEETKIAWLLRQAEEASEDCSLSRGRRGSAFGVWE